MAKYASFTNSGIGTKSHSTVIISLMCILLITFQHIQALLVGRVRIWVVWGTKGATLCVSYPVSTVTRVLRPLRWSNSFWACASICMWYDIQVHDILTVNQIRICQIIGNMYRWTTSNMHLKPNYAKKMLITLYKVLNYKYFMKGLHRRNQSYL